MIIPAYLNFALLLLISAVHLYWNFGGKWGLDVSVPEHKGTRAFQPGQMATLIVAVLFGGMALFFLYKIGHLSMIDPFIPLWLSEYGLWLLAGIFLLRAIGDFHYIGFTKRVRSTRFAELDTHVYSPLCLLLSIDTLLIIRLLAEA